MRGGVGRIRGACGRRSSAAGDCTGKRATTYFRAARGTRRRPRGPRRDRPSRAAIDASTAAAAAAQP